MQLALSGFVILYNLYYLSNAYVSYIQGDLLFILLIQIVQAAVAGFQLFNIYYP